MFDTIVIYGVGLLGGSIGLGCRKRNLASRIIGVGRNAEKLKRARELGALDDYCTEIEQLDDPCDLAVVCTPVGLIPEMVSRLANHLGHETLITDVGSTKASVVRAVRTQSAEANFVGSHPMAGSEKTGVENATADLYEGAACIVTEDSGAEPQSVENLEAFWKSLGSRVILLTPEEHDCLVADVSHTPHLAATALSLLLGESLEDSEDVLRIVGEGFRDTTRIAAGDPVMWRDICIHNREAILSSLHRLIGRLNRIRDAVEKKDTELIENLLSQGKNIRERVNK